MAIGCFLSRHVDAVACCCDSCMWEHYRYSSPHTSITVACRCSVERPPQGHGCVTQTPAIHLPVSCLFMSNPLWWTATTDRSGLQDGRWSQPLSITKHDPAQGKLLVLKKGYLLPIVLLQPFTVVIDLMGEACTVNTYFDLFEKSTAPP